MSSTTTVPVDLVLTVQQVEEWPDAGLPRELGPSCPAGRPVGRPAVVSLPALERAVPVSRGLARLWMDAERVQDEETRHTLLLLLSELVTNAVRHSGSVRIALRLWTAGGLLFAEVRDQGGTASVPRTVQAAEQAAEQADGGRGLALVAALAYTCGRRITADGDCVVWVAVPGDRMR